MTKRKPLDPYDLSITQTERKLREIEQAKKRARDLKPAKRTKR